MKVISQHTVHFGRGPKLGIRNPSAAIWLKFFEPHHKMTNNSLCGP